MTPTNYQKRSGAVYVEMSSYPVRKYGYKRKYRGTYPRRPPPTSRWSTYLGAGKQLAKDVMYLKTLINSEPHYHIVPTTNNYNYNGNVVSLCNIPQGDTGFNRTGNRVLPRYLNVKWQVESGSDNNIARVMLFRYWGESPTLAPSVAVNEILQNVGTQLAPLSHLNTDITGQKGDRNRRIEVLRNEIVSLDRVERRAYVCEWDVQMNGMGTEPKEHIEFRSTTTEEPLSGGVYILFIGKSATNDAFTVVSKLTFYDN